MRGRPRRCPRVLLVGAALLGALVLAWALWPQRALELQHGETGHVLRRLPLVEGAPVRLSYLHSIYSQPASEEFLVRGDVLELVGIQSPSEAVLEYYGRAEPIHPVAAGFALRITPEPHAILPVLASARGQRTLRYGAHVLPLHELAGDGARISLRVASVPRLMLRWPNL